MHVRPVQVRTLLLTTALLVGAMLLPGCSGCKEDQGGGHGDDGSSVAGTDDDRAGDTGVDQDGSSQDTGDGGTNDTGGGDGGRDTGVRLDGSADPLDPANAMRDSDCDGVNDQEEFSVIYPGGSQTDPNNPDS